ncbi:MAG TPA: hypothetical protein P5525_16320 [Candidatus Paceibacterota bacterium]|nr:hypothetical protein [Candidatus Paceibacterota bacterium]
MHRTNPGQWPHSHDYAVDTSVAEGRSRIVIAITPTMMVVEIDAGVAFGSMGRLPVMSGCGFVCHRRCGSTWID